MKLEPMKDRIMKKRAGGLIGGTNRMISKGLLTRQTIINALNEGDKTHAQLGEITELVPESLRQHLKAIPHHIYYRFVNGTWVAVIRAGEGVSEVRPNRNARPSTTLIIAKGVQLQDFWMRAA